MAMAMYVRVEISIHALREEGDQGMAMAMYVRVEISIHALREEGDARAQSAQEAAAEFLSTPSARRATDVAVAVLFGNTISIHALREEGDCVISVRRSSRLVFLSTPSARRATAATLTLRAQIENFYPRPPRGGRPLTLRAQIEKMKISIHALREEGDVFQGGRLAAAEEFLSTPSARRATRPP